MEIDTGEATLDPLNQSGWQRDGFLDGIRDQLREGHSKRELYELFTETWIAEVQSRKKPVTVRRYFWRFYYTIRDMSEDAPDLHARIVKELAERG